MFGGPSESSFKEEEEEETQRLWEKGPGTQSPPPTSTEATLGRAEPASLPPLPSLEAEGAVTRKARTQLLRVVVDEDEEENEADTALQFAEEDRSSVGAKEETVEAYLELAQGSSPNPNKNDGPEEEGEEGGAGGIDPASREPLKFHQDLGPLDLGPADDEEDLGPAIDASFDGGWRDLWHGPKSPVSEI